MALPPDRYLFNSHAVCMLLNYAHKEKKGNSTRGEESGSSQLIMKYPRVMYFILSLISFVIECGRKENQKSN